MLFEEKNIYILIIVEPHNLSCLNVFYPVFGSTENRSEND